MSFFKSFWKSGKVTHAESVHYRRSYSEGKSSCALCSYRIKGISDSNDLGCRKFEESVRQLGNVTMVSKNYVCNLFRIRKS